MFVFLRLIESLTHALKISRKLTRSHLTLALAQIFCEPQRTLQQFSGLGKSLPVERVPRSSAKRT